MKISMKEKTLKIYKILKFSININFKNKIDTCYYPFITSN